MCASIDLPSVEIASTPSQTLDAFEQVVFDIVLIDENIVAGDVNGFLGKLRTLKSGSKARLVLLTTAMTKAAVHEAIKAGVDAILLKPFSATDLQSRLQVLTNERDKARKSQWSADGPAYAVVS